MKAANDTKKKHLKLVVNYRRTAVNRNASLHRVEQSSNSR